MNPVARIRVFVLALVATLLVVWGVAIPGLLQWRLQAALRRALPAASVRVGVRGRPDALLAGRLARLTVDIRRATVDGLPVQALTADFFQVEVDSQRVLRGGDLAIRHIGAGRATLVLTEDGLQRYLDEAKGVKGARVRLADGIITVEGAIIVLHQELGATMSGSFVVQDGRQVRLRVQSFSVSGVELPPDVANVLIAPLNPLLSVDQLPIPLHFLTVVIERGRLMLTAEPVS